MADARRIVANDDFLRDQQAARTAFCVGTWGTTAESDGPTFVDHSVGQRSKPGAEEGRTSTLDRPGGGLPGFVPLVQGMPMILADRVGRSLNAAHVGKLCLKPLKGAVNVRRIAWGFWRGRR